jgi:dihydroflavonol-4-reductase
LKEPTAPARYWVAGATGFLGNHLVSQLRERGHPVTAVSRRGGSVADVRVEPVDILDSAAVAESARGSDGAFLVAGKVSRRREDAEELYQLHVVGTERALEGLRRAGVPKVVVASTSGTIAIGTDPDCIYDESAPTPLEHLAAWPYYRSKLYAERAALEANHPPDFEVVIVNPSLLLGPGDSRESSTGDVRRFLEGSIPAVPAGGIAFVDVRDAAEGMILAFLQGRAGERYLLNAKNLSIAAFFERLERLSGVRAPWLRMPKTKAVAIGLNQLFNRAVRAIGGAPSVDPISTELAQYFWYCTAKKAERELGWRPRDPGETLRDTIDDLLSRKAAFPKKRAESA